ncbi:M28 family metallopeptidase [Hahella aquimaris]|uniref:M28 family metallopeptidase n=1 Tax=Hahella sp. HNIBRBA332 TaxID=3015983 RepID=UPI00273B9EC8|nr:M28 family metallopeptidase [Hahella sp. HNIBRBA332]WLQ16613.1 M28 family metallopeptidase [Hahella sp. HNIBRBA332]
MNKYLRLTVPALLAASQLALADDVWITTDADGFAAIKRHFPEVIEANRARTFTANGVSAFLVSEDRIPEISQMMHHELNRCGGFIAHTSQESAQSAALYDSLMASAIAPQIVDYSIDNAEVVAAMQGRVKESDIRSTIQSLANFTNRYYTTQTGLQGAQWIKDKWQTLAGSRGDVTVEFFNHSWRQPSVILTIQGKTKPNEIVVLGGHQDSTAGFGTGEGTRAPGADDDASGIATLTSVIKAAMESGYKPDRTVSFMAYAAEEVGLRGSQAIAQSYSSQGKNVVGVLQLDMTNYKGSSGDIYIMQDYTNSGQNDFLADLVTTYQPTVTVGYSECGYGCSDHASWTNQGYAASFPFESTFNGSNPHIHTAQDTLDKSGGNANHAVNFGKLAAAYVAELAKGNFSDDPGPDPDPDPEDPVTEEFSGSVGRSQTDNQGPFKVEPGTDFSAVMTGTNDADLYVRFGAAPTTRNYDCRPYKGGSDETCDLKVPAGQEEAYVMVRGYSSATSNYNLKVTYTPLK